MGMLVGDWLTFDFRSSCAMQTIRYPVLYCMDKRRACSELDMADGGYDVVQTYVTGMKFEQYLVHDGFEMHYSLKFFRRDKDIWTS